MGTGSSRRYLRSPQTTTVTKWDLNGAFLHKEVSTNPTTKQIYYAGNSVVRNMTSVVKGASDNVLRTKTTAMKYNNDPSKWLMGMLTYSNVQSVVPNLPVLQRRSTFVYDPNTGRKKEEHIRDPGNNAILHKTAYGINEFGQVDVDGFGRNGAVTVSGPDFSSRTNKVTYDATQRYIASETNALGHTISHSYYTSGIHAGLRQQSIDANGLKTHYTYDSFARPLTTTALFGTSNAVTTTTSFHDCGVSGDLCPSAVTGNAEYYIKQVGQDGSQSREYIDQLGRTVRKATLGFNSSSAQWVFVDYQYNAKGDVAKVSEPYINGSGSVPWNTTIHDALGRPTQTVNAEGRIDTVSYNGLTVTSRVDTAGKNQKKVEVRDSLGNLKTVTDNANKNLSYNYDAFGLMISVTSPSVTGMTVPPTTMTYDILGHKRTMSDPDKGAWSYSYNGLGQLISQTNARSETTCMAYDKLGRMVKRVDGYTGTVSSNVGQATQSTNQCAGNTATASWSYDTASGAGKGQLHQVGGQSNYLKTFVYDARGRNTQITEHINGTNYVTNTSYDALNRVNVVRYPGPSNRLGVKHVYNNRGYLQALRNSDSNALYYQVNAQDARGNVVEEAHGNGLATGRLYNRDTGYLESIETGTSLSPTNRQHLEFSFDKLGNLDWRQDHLKTYEESFIYDSLNRLYTTTADFGNGQDQIVNIRYDALGNIKSKTGVGNYKYGSSCTNGGFGPHAVCQIWKGTVGTKGTSYSYDANGNMLSGDGRSITWSLFDKPTQISKSGNVTTMTYGPERQLLTRADIVPAGASNTVFVGGLYEKVNLPNGDVKERHYVGGHAIVTYTNRTGGSAGTNDIRYQHKDHLGSTVLITDGSGNEVESFSFDPWGKRRAATLADLQAILGSWASLDAYQKRNLTIPVLTLASEITNKGFTGHEQLDGVNLIHMGGRVYDAEIGRFLSADPFVQDSTNLQALNRYSYVQNNPLSYTDPSGYFLKKLIKKIGRAIGKAHESVFDAFISVHKKFFRAIAKIEGFSTAMSIGLGIACGPVAIACTTAFNAAMTAANGGTIGQVIAGAAVGFVSGGASAGIGGAFGGDLVANVGAAMIIGGSVAKAQGGKFIDGVKGAAVGAGISLGLRWIVSNTPVAEAEVQSLQEKAKPDFGPDGHITSEEIPPNDGFSPDPPNGGQLDISGPRLSKSEWVEQQVSNAIARKNEAFKILGLRAREVGIQFFGATKGKAALWEQFLQDRAGIKFGGSAEKIMDYLYESGPNSEMFNEGSLRKYYENRYDKR